MKLDINCHYKSGWVFDYNTISFLTESQILINHGTSKLQIFIR